MKSKNLKFLNAIFYFFVITLIIGLFAYDGAYSLEGANAKFTLEKYMKNPQLYGGHKDERLAKIINISDDHFYIRLDGKDVKISGANIQRPVMGESVFFLNYKEDGIIGLIGYHNYDYNYLLYAISAAAIIVFTILFFKEWRFTARGFKDA